MSFRQFGGLTYASKHNIVSSNYNTSNNLLIPLYFGQSGSVVNFLSDISANLTIYGNLSITKNLYVRENIVIDGNIDLSGNFAIDGSLDLSGNAMIDGTLDLSGNAMIDGSLDVSGNTDISGNVNIYQNLNVSKYITGYTGSFNYLNSTNNTYLATTNGSVGIGKTSTQQNYILDISGNVIVSGKTVSASFNTSSDYRIKSHIKPLNETHIIDHLNPVSYFNKITKSFDFGLIAHEVQEQFPSLVYGEKDAKNYQSVNYTGLIPILIKEIKELKDEVKILKTKINDI